MRRRRPIRRRTPSRPRARTGPRCSRRSRRRPPAPAGRRSRRAGARSCDTEPGRNAWPPQPGLTVMQSSRSSSVDQLGDGDDRRARAQGQAGAAAGVAHGRERVVGVRRGLDVERDAVRARLGELRDVALGTLDHQVDVEIAAGVVDLVGERGDDRRPHAERRDEVPVHDVDVDRARAGVEDLLHLRAQAREVGGEDRGGDAGGLAAPSRSAGASSSGSGCRRTGRCSTSARSSSARRSSGRPRPARSGAGSSRSGSAPGRFVAPQPRLVAGGTDVAQVDGLVAHGASLRRRRAMKNPSVPSRCGRVCTKPGTRPCVPQRRVGAQVVGREVPAFGQERLHDGLVLGGRDRAGGVHERAARAQRVRRRRAGSPPARARAARAGRRTCASARRGARRACRGPSTAGRRARGRRRAGSCGPAASAVRTSIDSAGAHARRPCGAAPRRARRGARRRRSAPVPRISAARCVVLPPGAAQRSRTRSPGRGSSSRPTVIAARDCGMKRPSPPQRRVERVERARRARGPRAARAPGWVATGSARGERRPGRRAAC